jgi:PleD family two-component response regulator
LGDVIDACCIELRERDVASPAGVFADEMEHGLKTSTKVLVVDDKRLIVDTITEILEGAGFEVIPAYDPWEALEAAACLEPDHLLTDVLMPGMNGVDLAIAVRKMYPSLRFCSSPVRQEYPKFSWMGRGAVTNLNSS